jgi:hypothetical protein
MVAEWTGWLVTKPLPLLGRRTGWLVDSEKGDPRPARPIGRLARVDNRAPRPHLAAVVDAWCRLRLGEVEVVIVRKSRTRWP